MKYLKYVGVILVSIILTLIIFSFLLTSKYKIERSINIDSSPAKIFDYISNIKKWQEWTIWTNKQDTTIKFTFRGPESGVGATQFWKSGKTGNGKITIMRSSPNEYIEYILEMDEGNFVSNGKILLEPIKDRTKVTWSDSGDIGANPIAKIFTYFFMDRFMGIDFEKGLKNLKMKIEKK
jgi:hypothetical protein